MKKAAVFYFSGTGNTRFVSELIAKHLTSFETALYPVEDVLNGKMSPDTGGYDLIGVGCPSIGFNPPRIVDDFCKILKTAERKRVFLFLTCGGPSYLNDAAFFHLKKILKRNGFDAVYEKTICMPANIFLKYSDDVVKKLFVAAERKTAKMAADLMNGVVKVRKDRIVPYLFRWIFFLMEKPFLPTMALDFHATKDCNRCGLCVNSCPRKNIRLGKRIRYGLNCEACYRCVYICPKKAIRGRLYHFTILKDGYNIRKMFERTKDLDGNGKLKGIYKTLKSYLKSDD